MINQGLVYTHIFVASVKYVEIMQFSVDRRQLYM